MKIYIASSWKNQHAVEMLTALLRNEKHVVISWIENNFGEDHNPIHQKGFDFETWVNSEASDDAFYFDTRGAMLCDLFIYIGPAGKDAAAECGICYGQMGTKKIPMLGLFAKGEDFGLMRKMFDSWFDHYTDLLEEVQKYSKGFD